MKSRTATPVRAIKTEQALQRAAWNEATIKQAQQVVGQEFSPLTDMRASAAYRRMVLSNLLRRAWLEQQGHGMVQLGDLP